ncbi:MAG: hypothetical protein PHW83_08350 [Bacteroidales bacterium]|nr:hypothetical protein [Bacteroidales bacterium]
MKKVLIILAVFALICLGLYSCKTTNDCPAYGKANNDLVKKRV